jgi:hypothetical protein
LRRVLLEEAVSPSEAVARFITQKTYYRSSDGTVRHNAFMPYKHKETSVYRIIDLDDDKVFEIGRRFVADVMNFPLLGRADIVVSKILEKDLRVEPNPIPHPRHANIVDWPEEISKHRLIAIELAAEAELHLLDS